MKFDSLVNVCVFIGGCSVEHEISLISGLQAVLNIDRSKYCVKVVYLSKDNELIYLKEFKDLEFFKKGLHLNKRSNCYFKRQKGFTYLVYKCKKWKVDVCFPIVHGRGVEDGTLSGYFNLLKVPNVCSDVVSSGIAQDKVLCKTLLKSSGIRMCKFVEIRKDTVSKGINKVMNNFSFPVILKPSRLGSSIGIVICNDVIELENGICDVFKYDEKVIVEEKLANFVEYNMACFSSKGELVLSEVEEVKSSNEFLTFDDKYASGGLKEVEKENRVIPASIDDVVHNEISNYTKTVYKKLGFSGVVRMDYLYDLNENKLYFNEVNVIPGSLSFYLYKDYSFKELLDLFIKDAMFRFEKDKELISSFESNILAIKDLKMKK